MKGLQEQGYKTNIPTLILTECLLVYLRTDEVNEILQTLVGQFDVDSSEVHIVNYEMIKPDD